MAFFVLEWVDFLARHYVAGWFALALINAGLAQGKNRTGLWWFLWSLLFGPFATLALVVFYEKLKYEQPSAQIGAVPNKLFNPDDFAPEGSPVPWEEDNQK